MLRCIAPDLEAAPVPLRRPAPESLAVAMLLTAMVALGPISTDMYLASLPILKTVFATDTARVQLTLSVFLAGFALGQLVYGPLSDRFGRRPVLAAGLGLYLAASIACTLAWSIEALIAARLVQAVGACAGPVLGRAVVRDVHGPTRAATVLSYMASAMALAPAIGPILGGYVTVALGWQANFVIMAAAGLALLAALALMLDETNRWRDPSATAPGRLLANYLGLLHSRVFVGYALTMALSYCAIFAFISGSSFVLIEVLGVGTEWFGYGFAAAVLGYMAGTLLAGRLTARLGIDRLILAGAVIGAAAAGVMAAAAWLGWASLATVVGPMAVAMVGIGLVMPNATAGAIAPFPRMAGTASALMGFMQMGLAAVLGGAIGHIHDGTARPMATGIALALFGCLAVFLAVRPGQVSPPGDQETTP